MKLNVTISYSEYKEIKQNIRLLSFTWRKFLQEKPNDWYEFKYHFVVEKFLSEEKQEEALFSTIRLKLFTRRAKMTEQTYHRLVELSEISAHLQAVLKYPPFGVMNYDEVLENTQYIKKGAK